MEHRFCEDCQQQYDVHGVHICPGADTDRISALEEQVAELREKLERYESIFVPGTKLLVPCRAVKSLDGDAPGLRWVETKYGTLLRIRPGDAVLDER